jgi:hypothetical protein
MMRYAIPVVDRRGAGLGNELILWAKAFVAGQALGLKTLHPAWGINRRNYWRYFGTSRSDYVVHRLLRAALPKVRFDEEDYVRCGGGDFADALTAFARERGLERSGPLALEIAGLWGGPGMLYPAREFVRGQLLGTRYTAANLYQVARRAGDERLRIGVHLRRGDFGAPVARGAYAGTFNVAVPLAWYEAMMATLHRAFGDGIVFVIASDASAAELTPLTSRFPCVTTMDLPNSDVSDLIALATSDFLICSISSFSLWAAFLGEMPYAWFRPQLSEFAGTLSIWGHQAPQQQPASPLGQARAEVASLSEADPIWPRGIPVDEDGALSDELMDDLRHVLWRRRRATDLIRYGVVQAG